MTPVSKTLDREVATPSHDLKEIVRPILPHLNEVEQKLNLIAGEGEGILRESSAYVLSGGGKRLRAALVLFCSSLYGNKVREPGSRAVEIAVAVELIHSATLVHDDIIDRAVLRRLKPTVNVQYGDDVAVLLGDFLYARAFELITSVGNDRITGWMAEATRRMCEGEIDQLRHRYRADLTLEEYFSFIERKTACLISACARSGARLAGLPENEENAMAAFGLNMGMTFQIVDDLLDVIGIEKRLGKTLRTDVGNGKMTLPLILLMERLEEAEKRLFACNLSSPDTDWKEIEPLIKKHRIQELTEDCANDFFKRASQAIQLFDPTIRVPLENLSRFILKRDY